MVKKKAGRPAKPRKKVDRKKRATAASPVRKHTPKKAAARRFVNDLLVRGEAQELDPNGKLPRDATHVIEKRHPDGSVEVRRARFKLF